MCSTCFARANSQVACIHIILALFLSIVFLFIFGFSHKSDEDSIHLFKKFHADVNTQVKPSVARDSPQINASQAAALGVPVRPSSSEVAYAHCVIVFLIFFLCMVAGFR